MEIQKQELNTDELLSPEELVEKYNLEVAAFFDQEAIEGIQVKVFDNKESLFEYYKNTTGREGADYLVAFSPGNLIAILGKDAMPDGGSDKGPIRYQKVMKHEIVHKYIRGIIKDDIPGWLSEGTCCYVASQNKGKLEKDKITLQLLDDLSHTDDGRKYAVGTFIVTEIVNNFGKEKLIQLLEMNEDERKAELQRMFDWLKVE